MLTSKFKKNFLSVLTGNGIAQLLLLLAMPLLTRLFSPEHFGLAAIFSAVLQLMVAICTWRFDWLVPNSSSVQSAAAKIACGCIALLAITLLSVPFLIAIQHWSSYSQFDELGIMIYLIPVALAGRGLHQLLQAWFIRESNLIPVSKTKVAQTLGYIATAILAYVLRLEDAALILAVTVSSWFGATFLMVNASLVINQIKNLKASRVRWVFKRNARLASISVAVALLNTVSSTFALFALSFVYSTFQIGLFSLVLRLVTTPLSVVSTALTQSFWSRASELSRQSKHSELRTVYLRVTRYLFAASLLVGAVCFGGSFFLAPLLGESWGGVGEVLRSMIPTFIGLITFTPTNHLVVLNRQSMQLWADLTRLLLMALATTISLFADANFSIAVFFIAVSSLIGHAVIFLVHLLCYRDLETKEQKKQR